MGDNSTFVEDWIVTDSNEVSTIILLEINSNNRGSIDKHFDDLDSTIIGDMQSIVSNVVKLLKDDFDFLVNISTIIVFATP